MKLKILVADDDLISLQVIVNYLIEEGFEVEAVTDGEQAWTLLQKKPQHFDLVLADRIMPKLHAIDLLKKIKNHPQLGLTPVIILTGVAEKDEMIEALQEGVFDFLYKPVEKNLLISVVKKAINQTKFSCNKA